MLFLIPNEVNVYASNFLQLHYYERCFRYGSHISSSFKKHRLCVFNRTYYHECYNDDSRSKCYIQTRWREYKCSMLHHELENIE